MKLASMMSHVPVIVLTAKIERGLEEKAREKRLEYFVKPCPMETLFGAIDAILRPPAGG